MKKNLKLVLALIVAVMMIVSSISAIAVAPEGLTADTSITISGLDDNDTVNLYKVIEWDEGDATRSANWKLTTPFADDADCKAVLQRINAVTEGVYTLTEDDVNAFTAIISAGSASAVKTTGGTVTDGSSTTTVAPGMYIALVKAANTNTLYNPIVVSADYNADNNTNIMGSDVPLSQATVGASANAKKEDTKVEKEQDDPQDTTDNSYDVGDTVNFTVKTTIPAFADVYTEPKFTVTDTLSTGLELTTGTIKVYEADGTTEITALTAKVVENSTTGWTLDVPTDYILALDAAKPLVIKYDAVLTTSAETNVHEETNDVEVVFSNNPDNKEDKGKVKDKTRTYTFSIDGNLLGAGGDQTSELIKVAVDGNGNPIMQSTATGVTYENALAGAVFGLYLTEADANNNTNNYTNDEFTGTVTTDKDGYMKITGLDVGTYYLKEISAPAGYIKDQKVHTIEITAEYGTETVTEDGYTYDLPVLESYSIKIDNATTSTYSMKLSEEKITTSDADNPPTSIINTKGIELPSTGGMGTTIFYVGGSILVLAAAILLITKRRMGVED